MSVGPKFIHGKKLRITTVNAKVSFRLKVPWIKNILSCLFNQNLHHYLRLLLCENDENSAMPVVDCGHLGYRKFASHFRTTLIYPAIYFLR